MTEPLRVLHLFDSYLHRTENWAYNLVYHLPGVKVFIASKHFLPCNFYPNKFEYVIPPLRSIENPDRLLALRVLNRMIPKLLCLYTWYLQKRLNGKCDLMHSHFAPVAWEYRKLAKRLKVPHVVSFYGYDYEHLPFNEPIWRKRYQILFREADLFLCEGSHGTKILQNMGCPEEKIRIARLGVDVEHIPIWKRIKKHGELNLLQIATFTEKKGHRYAIEAFLKALPDCPNLTLTFIGNDRDGIKADLQQRIKGTPAEDKIVFKDAIDFDFLHEFMKDYHVFVHPSCYSKQKDCEGGAPIVFLDAQATGMPVISTLHCDIPDEVIHGQTGLLSEEKDIGSLVNSIKVFYTMNQDEYDIYMQNARKHVEENYNIKKNAAYLRKIYTKLNNLYMQKHK